MTTTRTLHRWSHMMRASGWAILGASMFWRLASTSWAGVVSDRLLIRQLANVSTMGDLPPDESGYVGFVLRRDHPRERASGVLQLRESRDGAASNVLAEYHRRRRHRLFRSVYIWNLVPALTRKSSGSGATTITWVLSRTKCLRRSACQGESGTTHIISQARALAWDTPK